MKRRYAGNMMVCENAFAPDPSPFAFGIPRQVEPDPEPSCDQDPMYLISTDA